MRTWETSWIEIQWTGPSGRGRAGEHSRPPRFFTPPSASRLPSSLLGVENRGGLECSPVARRVRDLRLREALLAHVTGVAAAAGAHFAGVHERVVAAVRQAEVDAQLDAALHDRGLAELDQRRVHAEARALLRPGGRREPRELLESAQELRPAIGIAGVIEHVDPEEQVARAED